MISLINIVIVFIFSFNYCFSQQFWINLNFPIQGEVNHIATNSKGDVFCSIYETGIYRYTFSENKWDLLSNDWDLNDPKFGSIIIGKNDCIFAVNASEGIKKSTDNGESWVNYNWGEYFQNISLISNNEGIVFAYDFFNIWLYQLIDSNKTYWKNIKDNNFYCAPTNISLNSTNYLYATYYCYEEIDDSNIYFTKIMKYDIEFEEWSNIKDSLSLDLGEVVEINVDKDDNLYCQLWYHQEVPGRNYLLFADVNNNTWTEINGNLSQFFDTILGIYPLETITISKDKIFMTTNDGIIKSINDEFIFEYFHDGIEDVSEPDCMYLSNNGHLYVSLNNEIYYTSEPVTNVIDENIKRSDITIYPNPSSNFLNIDSRNNIQVIEIFDLIGNKIIDCKPNESVSNFRINISDIMQGLYFIRITNDIEITNYKMIKI